MEFVAVLCDWDAFDQVHHKVGAARIGLPCIEHSPDVGMVHHRQRLAFSFEASDHLLGVHAHFDDLQRYPTPDWLSS